MKVMNLILFKRKALYLSLFIAMHSIAADDLLIADFEGRTYGDWKVKGTAFGSGPAQGTLEKQRTVSGFIGNGLVNSYHGRDASTGTLTSPPFKIERQYINFLIGGGRHPGETCINLLVDGQVVRTETGPSFDKSGSEALSWKNWSVEGLKGKTAMIEIVDQHTGGWGHINIDHIIQSDTAQETEVEEISQRVFPESKAPRYTFANTLRKQEEQLAENPLLKRFAASREKLNADPHYPRYHFSSPENRLNDPNGLCFWKGNWHLFYQGYPPEDSRQHWGHAVSTDLIHWKDLPYAIYPSPEDKCFSGTTLVENDRVIAMYHGVGVGTMVAVSDDPLLLNWSKVSGKAVIPHKPGLPYNIFDPSIWKQEDYYYALTAGQLPNKVNGKLCRAEFLHRSKDLKTWEYLHPFLENDIYGMVGDDGACPYFWPLGNKYIMLHFTHKGGGKYMLGDYDTKRDKFVITDGGEFNFGPVSPCGVHAPSATPDGKGGVYAIFNMNPGKRCDGWNQLMTLPIHLALAENDEIDPLRITPAGDYESLRGNHQSIQNINLPMNEEVILDNINGNTIELIAEIDCANSQIVELNVLRSADGSEVTRIIFLPKSGYNHRELTDSEIREKNGSALSIDTSRSTTLADVGARPAETCYFSKENDEPLKLHVFIDRSVVEVFANDKKFTAVRVYPGKGDSVGVSLCSRASSATLKSLDCWQMQSIYE